MEAKCISGSAVCLTGCSLGDVHLWGLLLLRQEGRYAAQLREAVVTAAGGGGGQASTLELLRFHLADVRGVRGGGGLCAERRRGIGTRTC